MPDEHERADDAERASETAEPTAADAQRAGSGDTDEEPAAPRAGASRGEARPPAPVSDVPVSPATAAASAAANDGYEPASASAPRPVSPTSPLITAIEIENFKGIGRPMRVDLRPITLLFGNNSAGKSTVLHALCYAHEILSHRNVDARKTDLGGDQIDLGGFPNLVHARDLTRAVRLRFELDLGHRSFPDLAGLPTSADLPSWAFGNPSWKDGWLELVAFLPEERSEPNGSSDPEVGIDGRIRQLASWVDLAAWRRCCPIGCIR